MSKITGPAQRNTLQAAKQPNCSHAKHVHNLQKFNHIETPLPALIFCDERLRFAQATGNFSLSEAFCLARFD
jgi:hypothetical protein